GAEMTASPYLSIVVAGRNDNYGGNFLDRLTVFARHMGEMNRLWPDLFEVVVVEWNPPAERPPLADAIDWSMLPNCRIVTVPRDVHALFDNPGKMPIFEY